MKGIFRAVKNSKSRASELGYKQHLHHTEGVTWPELLPVWLYPLICLGGWAMILAPFYVWAHRTRRAVGGCALVWLGMFALGAILLTLRKPW